MSVPLIRAIDAVQVPVPDLDAALSFCRDSLGHELVWKTSSSAGLRLPDGGGEIVLQTERPSIEPNFLVDSADAAAQRFAGAGGSIVAGPFDIQIGRCVVVQDPWGNHLVLLDMTKGP